MDQDASNIGFPNVDNYTSICFLNVGDNTSIGFLNVGDNTSTNLTAEFYYNPITQI